MKEFLKKIGSRKFLMALISVVSGIMTMANCGDNLIQFVCSLLMIIVPAVVYIITEGVLDYTGIGLALEQIIEAIQIYIDSKEENENTEENETVLEDGTVEVSKDGIAIID